MISSMNNGEFAQQIETIRQTLASIRDRLLTQTALNPTFQTEIDQELQTAIQVLQAARSLIQAKSSAIDQLQATVQQKEMLLREIHHRIKNNLQIIASLIDLQVLRSQDAAVQSLLRNYQTRIRLMALVHERLSESSNATTIRLGGYVQELTLLLAQTYEIEPERITLQTLVRGEIELASNQVVAVGLILNELISNALKHGLSDQAGEIAVSLRIEDSQVALTVSDTGDRLPANFDLSSPQTLGFQIINSLVYQLNANLTIDRSPHTAITLQFDVADWES
ncbi:hypothetical protein H6F51_00070 [Cyanobacteria bacterium FACHB-DQ100]|nr:hypothetical protein [Cyanobacteria bacterium FACHB-DQ100]